MPVLERMFRRNTTVPASAAAAETEPDYVVIRSGNPIISDADGGQLLRRAFLDRIDLSGAARAVIVDVSPVLSMSLGAAEEMVVPWLRVAGDHRAPVGIKTYSTLARRVFDSALKRGNVVAYWIPRTPATERDPELIGASTPQDQQSLDIVRANHGFASSSGMNPTTKALFDESAKRGVLLQSPDGPDTLYREPFPLSSTAVAERLE